MKSLNDRVTKMIDDLESVSARAVARGELEKPEQDEIFALSQRIREIVLRKTHSDTTRRTAPSLPGKK